ncbi:MAG: hypothetical protein LBT05_02705 [Planctomycetaceae bacterium]|nr:hypothetical protein [Planctomycetaceae bacterium]
MPILKKPKHALCEKRCRTTTRERFRKVFSTCLTRILPARFCRSPIPQEKETTSSGIRDHMPSIITVFRGKTERDATGRGTDSGND